MPAGTSRSDSQYSTAVYTILLSNKIAGYLLVSQISEHKLMRTQLGLVGFGTDRREKPGSYLNFNILKTGSDLITKPGPDPTKS